MQSNLLNLTYEVEIEPGEKLTLPQTILDTIGAGRWMIVIRPLVARSEPVVRDHSAFLNSYVAEDEGLYDKPQF